MATTQKEGPASPKVFISYSHDSPEHTKRVVGLSERLREDGIDADLDQYVNGTPDRGWPRWMLNRLEWADRVLVVCTETYYRRFRGHEEPNRGRGVDWEGAIILNELYTSKSRTTKFVPVLFEEDDEQFVPNPLSGCSQHLLNSEFAYQELYDSLLGQSGVEPGRLGPLRRQSRRRVDPARFGSSPPEYRNPKVKALSEKLQNLIRRRDVLREAGERTSELDQQILQTRRDLRTGTPEPGWELGDGRYLLRSELGHGGFATVFKARDRREHREVAVKVIHSHLAGDSARLERFFRGARIMAELDHPGIVKVLEPHGEDQGYHYFVMELVQGGTLRDAVRTNQLSPDAALDCIMQVGEALAAAHAKGRVHRDVKPANILMTTENRAKLSDFDLVGAGDTTGGTRTGVLGSYPYAAPECMVRPQDATPAADVYSLAMTMVYALTGEDPNPRTFEQAISQLPCDEATKTVLRKATSVDPEMRPEDAGELVARLRNATQSVPLRSRRWRQTIRSMVVSLAIVLVCSLATYTALELTKTPAHEGASRPHPVHPSWAERLERDEYGLVASVRIANETTTRLRWIPPGWFLMGSSESEEGRDDDERQHPVALMRGFWLGETEVTQAEWAAVMGDNPSFFENEHLLSHDRDRISNSLAHAKGDRRPVESVSWDDCQDFLKRVGQANPGLEVRLPTEAEWEYAARAGTQTPFSFGENITTDQVNYDGNYPYAGAAKGEYRKRTVSVRSLPPNNWGLYEVHGNVSEWCSDWYGELPTEEQRDPNGPAAGRCRVLRGGSWAGDAGDCRSAQRNWSPPYLRKAYLGFRLLAVQPGEPE